MMAWRGKRRRATAAPGGGAIGGLRLRAAMHDDESGWRRGTLRHANAQRRRGGAVQKNGARGAPVQAVCWISKPLLVVSSASAMASASFDGIWRSTSLVFWSTSLTTVRLLSGSMENSRPWALACGDLLSLSTAWSSAEAGAAPLTASTVSTGAAGACGVPATATAAVPALALALLRSGARGVLTAPLEAIVSIVMMRP